MKVQKLTIAIHPVVAVCKPELLAYLMTLDHYCLPIKDGQKERGPKCGLYFRKSFNKKKLRALNNLSWPKGLYIHFCNCLDTPCLIQDGHDPEYAVKLWEVSELKELLTKLVKEVRV